MVHCEDQCSAPVEIRWYQMMPPPGDSSVLSHFTGFTFNGGYATLNEGHWFPADETIT